MKKSIQAIEHTPIYDLNVYNQRKRQLHRKQLFKNFIDGFAALSTVVFTVSLYFFGGH